MPIHETRKENMTPIPTFKIDLNDPYQVHHIIGDINDHLLEAGFDGDAEDFIFKAKTLDESSLDEILSLAADYVDIEDVSDSRGVRADEYDDEPVSGNLSWDSEAAAIKRALEDGSPHAPMLSVVPVDLSVPEYPNITLIWDFEEPLGANMLRALKQLALHADDEDVLEFIHNWRGLRSHTWTYRSMFQLVWSWMTVLPDPDQYGSDDW